MEATRAAAAAKVHERACVASLARMLTCGLYAFQWHGRAFLSCKRKQGTGRQSTRAMNACQRDHPSWKLHTATCGSGLLGAVVRRVPRSVLA